MLRIMGVVAKIGHNRWFASLADEEPALQIETADVSLIGHREENQDRVAIAAAEQAVLLVVIDGMGGHADGAPSMTTKSTACSAAAIATRSKPCSWWSSTAWAAMPSMT